MRTRAAIVACLLALLVAGLLLWPRANEGEGSVVPGGAERRTTRFEVAPSEGPAPDPAPEPPSPPRDATAVEEALTALARAEGSGRVACPLPAGTGPVEAFGRMERIGDVLHMTVHDAEGRLYVRLESDEPFVQKRPIGRFVWEGAWPGEWGRCRFDRVEVVEMRGEIRFPDGSVLAEADPGVFLIGCFGAAELEEDGRFLVEAAAGDPCELMVVDGGTRGEGKLKVEAASARDDLVVVIGPGEPIEQSLDAIVGGLRKGMEAERERVNPLEVALESEGLSEGARAVLAQWLAEQRAASDEALQTVGEIEDVLEENRELFEQLDLLVPPGE